MTRAASLHADAPADRRPAGAAALALQALSPAEITGDAEIVRTVIPAPGADGRLETRDDRRPLRVSDPAALAAAINAQDVDVRIDFDHQSERVSPTFRGSTAAEGWARRFRAAADGGIEAALELSGWARHAIEQGQYRYLSPALWFNKETGEVEGMSSVALVNDPSMRLGLNSAGSGDPGSGPSPEERERRATEREAAAERMMMAAAERSVDRAVADQRLMPAQKDFALNAIRTNASGIEAGLAAFESAYPASPGAPRPGDLDRRTAPAGAPSPGAPAPGAPAFHAPPGREVDADGLALHARVAAHARDRGISYRQSVIELGALQ